MSGNWSASNWTGSNWDANNWRGPNEQGVVGVGAAVVLFSASGVATSDQAHGGGFLVFGAVSVVGHGRAEIAFSAHGQGVVRTQTAEASGSVALRFGAHGEGTTARFTSLARKRAASRVLLAA